MGQYNCRLDDSVVQDADYTITAYCIIVVQCCELLLLFVLDIYLTNALQNKNKGSQ